MYVCVCKGITEKQIQNAAKEGVESFKCLRQQTGIGTQCGKCCAEAKSCLQQHLAPELTYSFG